MKALITLNETEIKEAIVELLKQKGFAEVKNSRFNITQEQIDGPRVTPASVGFTCEVELIKKEKQSKDIGFVKS
jgi:hypothetical protein